MSCSKTLAAETLTAHTTTTATTESPPSPEIIRESVRDKKIIDAGAHEFTVDGLRLKASYVEYYKLLKFIVDTIIMYISKELNMKDYDQVYALGRQLYEILRSIFVDEPFKLWVERNSHRFCSDDEVFKKDLETRLEIQLKELLSNKNVLKTSTFKAAITDMLNAQLHHDTLKAAATATANGDEVRYIKPDCIVDTYNCCDLVFSDTVLPSSSSAAAAAAPRPPPSST
uniref:DekiORF80 n=1 Tax=Dendrolimus kikuchii nucleopolyhedrovirus TaxID=1219875 RepID=V9LSX6_9ABAC|nr:DekiORF80 [Dendrolimus kikuchii nucleopolyhedrovirus]